MKKSLILLALLAFALPLLALNDITPPVGGAFYDGTSVMPRQNTDTTTDNTAYTPRYIGDILLGYTGGTSSLWIATALTTGDWSLVSAMGSPINAAELLAGSTVSAINAAAATNLNGASIASGNIDLARTTNALATAGSSIGGNMAQATLTNALASSGAWQADTNTTTGETTYMPRYVGDMLTGQAGSGTGAMWVAVGLTTNDWAAFTP